MKHRRFIQTLTSIVIVALTLSGCVTPVITPIAQSPTADVQPETLTPVQELAIDTASLPTPTASQPISTSTLPVSSEATADAYDYREIGSIHGPSDGIAGLALSPDGSLLAYGSYADNFVHLVDFSTDSPKEIRTLEGHTAAVSGLAFSPDGSLVASTGTVNLPPEIDGTVRLWDVETGEQLAVFQTEGVRQLAFSPDGAALAGAAGGDPVKVILWDVAARSQKMGLDGIFATVSFSPDGTLLASGSRDELVHVLDVGTGNEVLSLSGHQGQVSSTAFSPDGEILASGSDDKTIQLWNTETGEKLKSLIGHESQVGTLAFSPDGSVLASLGTGYNITQEGDQFRFSAGNVDTIIRLWTVENGNQIGTIEVANGVGDLAFNTDWTRLAIAEYEGGTIQLWGVKQ